MKTTNVPFRIAISALCAVLCLNGMPLRAADAREELRHEAFLRGGQAISIALNANETPTVVTASTKSVIPRGTATRERELPQLKTSRGMSKLTWIALMGGFAVAGGIVYWAATGTGSSVRNCSTCKK